DPQALLRAGLRHPQCLGVLALTGSDAVNTKVALTARLLAPDARVYCAVSDHAWHARMALAGADALINPFDTFASGCKLRSMRRACTSFTRRSPPSARR
ncbi:MAG: NAD-binding protein, partial [Inhella sp.]